MSELEKIYFISISQKGEFSIKELYLQYISNWGLKYWNMSLHICLHCYISKNYKFIFILEYI